MAGLDENGARRGGPGRAATGVAAVLVLVGSAALFMHSSCATSRSSTAGPATPKDATDTEAPDPEVGPDDLMKPYQIRRHPVT